MKQQLILTAAILAIAGCGADKSATSREKAPLAVDAINTKSGGLNPSAGGSTASAAALNASNGVPAAGMVVPPEGANWTLWVRAFSGPAHIEQSKLIKDQLAQTTGMKDWYLIHSDNDSILYYGYYRAVDDPKHEPADTRRAKADHAKLMGMKDPSGAPVFRGTLFVNVNAPDPDAPPEWDLYRVDALKVDGDPTRAYWSILVASYSGSADRKRLAVESVREARKVGVPAFYHHGETVSDVFIGTWPRSAVKEQIVAEAAAAAHDENTRLMVSNVPLPDAWTQNVRDRENKPVSVLQPKLEIADPSMQETLARYPAFALNGEEDRRVEKTADGRNVVRVVPSAVVLIPRDAAAQGSLITTQTRDDPTNIRLLAPPGRGVRGGRLDSVGP